MPPGLTITAAQFRTATRDNWRHFRSKRLDEVLRLLDAEATNPDLGPDLIAAVRTWYQTDPNEFRRRNGISNGLCAQLMRELGLGQIDTLPLSDTAFEVVATAMNVNQQPDTATRFLGVSVDEYILHRLIFEVAHSAVILIDMQAASFGAERHGRTTVAEAQGEVLDIAREVGIDVFEIRIARHAPQYTEGLTNHPTLPTLAAKLPTDNTLVRIEKPYFSTFEDTQFAAELTARHIQVAVVMGYDANTCVWNTIFGKPASIKATPRGNVPTPYVPGLLERGIRVVTSRSILASHGAALDAKYGVRV